MKITVGTYRGTLDPTNEIIVDNRENLEDLVEKAIKDYGTNGIWLVSIYDDANNRVEQVCCYNGTAIMGSAIKALTKGTMKEINFNALAWETPDHNGRYEYRPDDKHYQEIIDWLNSADKVIWECTENDARCIRRLEWIYNQNHVKATIYPDTKGVSYYFVKSYCYEIPCELL